MLFIFNMKRVISTIILPLPDGKFIPAGTNIGISPLYLGRREEH